mmetsp:Transcript_15414/g.38840  ORF Transcript_15414/g.38840 Transcript_15414/m.38840 type:complete len:252 (-) Transcript_15414:140-895(-)
MFLLNYNKVQITSLVARLFVGHILERNRFPVPYSLEHVDGQLDFLGLGFALALRAVWIPHFPWSNTSFISLLYLLNESRSNLLSSHSNSRTLALWGIFHAHFPFHAQDLANVRNFKGSSRIHLFQGQLQWNIDIGCSGLFLSSLASAKASSEKLFKGVESSPAAAALLALLVLFQTLFAVSIVNFPRFFVTQSLIGTVDLCEFFCRTLRLVLVGMEFEGFLTVGLLDLLFCCLARNAEQLVKVSGICKSKE